MMNLYKNWYTIHLPYGTPGHLSVPGPKTHGYRVVPSLLSVLLGFILTYSVC